jgi:hypothetical protein
LPSSAGRIPAPGHDDVHRETDQLGCEVGEAIELIVCVAVLDGEVLPLDIAEVAQPLPEGLGDPPDASDQVANAPYLACRLRRVGKRHCEQAQGERHDAPDSAAPHDHLLTSTSCRPTSFR